MKADQTHGTARSGAETARSSSEPRPEKRSAGAAEITRIQFAYSRDDAARILMWLILLELLLVSAYCLAHIVLPDLRWGPVRELVDMNRESAIPTWFSTIQLFVISVLLLIVARLPTQLRRYLILFSFGFLFLSMDEAAEIHERVVGTARTLRWRWLLWLTFDGSHKAWVIPYLIVAAAGAVACYRFFILVWRNYRAEAVIVAGGLALFCAGGIGFEMLTFKFYNHPAQSLYLGTIAAEEFLEMLGMSIVLYGVLLLHLKAASLLSSTPGGASRIATA